jgi:dTDP-4-dehydrorhamnose 3,5-epimerase
MGNRTITEGFMLTPLRRIPTTGGDVLHAVKSSDSGFERFGEAYFSSVEPGAVKGWKRHHQMILNLVVPVGKVRFVVRDDAGGSAAFDLGVESEATYARLTVQPGLWMAFGGASNSTSLVLNVASLLHDPDEADRKDLSEMPWSWS